MKNLSRILITVSFLSFMLFTSCSKLDLAPDSAFLSSTESAKGGNGVKIAAADLPALVKTYISTNYPSATIIKAEKSATKYEVTLSTLVKLEFNLNGTFREVSGGTVTTPKTSDDPKVTLPAAINAYIAANHPGATVIKSEFSLGIYEVILSNGYKLKFNSSGGLIESKFIGNKKKG